MTKKENVIVKIQRPIVTNEVNPQALVYNEDRSILLTVPYSDVEELFEDGELKIYVQVHVENGELNIAGNLRLDTQEW